MPQCFIVLTAPVAVNVKSVWLFAAVCVVCSKRHKQVQEVHGKDEEERQSKGPLVADCK